MVFNYSGRTDKGPRNINEDGFRCIVKDDALFLIVLDGLGIEDESKGIPASSLVLTHLEWFIQDFYNKKLNMEDFLKELFFLGNTIVQNCKYANKEVYLNYGASLLICALKDNKKLTFANVGNNRLYLIRKNNLFQGSIDDNEASDLLRKGKITKEEYETHEGRNKLTNGLGFNKKISPYVQTIVAEKEDLIILVTDGVYRVLGDERMKQLIIESGELDTSTDWLLKGVSEVGAVDNMTAIVSYIN